MGSKIAAIVMAVIAASAVADVWGHPTGTKQAGDSLIGLLRPSLQAASGQKIT